MQTLEGQEGGVALLFKKRETFERCASLGAEAIKEITWKLPIMVHFRGMLTKTNKTIASSHATG